MFSRTQEIWCITVLVEFLQSALQPIVVCWRERVVKMSLNLKIFGVHRNILQWEAWYFLPRLHQYLWGWCPQFGTVLAHFIVDETSSFWATVCRPMLLVRCPSCLSVCLSVCDLGVLWPNAWTDQDETWHGGRPRSWPHCVRGNIPPLPQRGTAPCQFSVHICCGQMAGWIKMPLGMDVGLGPGHIVLDGDPFWPMSVVTNRLID